MVWSFLRKRKKTGRKHNTTDFESCSEAPTRKSTKKLTLKSRSSKDVSPELLKVPFQSCASSDWVILLLAGSKHEDILKILLPNQWVKTPKICLAPNYLHSHLSKTTPDRFWAESRWSDTFGQMLFSPLLSFLAVHSEQLVAAVKQQRAGDSNWSDVPARHHQPPPAGARQYPPQRTLLLRGCSHLTRASWALTVC